MTDPKPPAIDWNHMATELRAARWKEREDWGDFDEELTARYIAGLATPEERAQVERQSTEFECVRQLLEQTRHLEAPQVGPDPPAAVGALNAKNSASMPLRWADSPPFNRRFLAALSAAAAVLLVALGGLTSWVVLQSWEIRRLARELDRDLQREQVAELSRSIETLEKTFASYERNRDKPVRLTSDAANRPVGWNDLLHEFYRKDKPAETVVHDLLQVGGDRVRDEIKRLRDTDPEATPEQILDALFQRWGGPEDEGPR